jgi:hypothetical protein
VVKALTIPEITVTTAGTRVQVSSTDTPISSIIIQASSGNSGVIYVGDSSVSSTAGIVLTAGQAWAVTADASGRHGFEEMVLSDFWVDSASNGDKFKVVYMKRR